MKRRKAKKEKSKERRITINIKPEVSIEQARYNIEKVLKLLENETYVITVVEKECTHPEGCEHVKTKFICTKKGTCKIYENRHSK